jgi:hypothetical protein
MQKVEHNLSSCQPMKTEILVDFMSQAYQRKLGELMKKDDRLTFEDTVY